MLTFMRALFLSLFCLIPAFAAAETSPPPAVQGQTAVGSLQAADDKALDADFTALAKAQSAAEAEEIERRILTLFSESGSATIDLMMVWAARAVEEDNYPAALDLLDQVAILRPRFAEVYNRRATIRYLMQDYSKALSDLRLALAFEPRHFKALSMLAAILRNTGRPKRAMEIYRQILVLHPHFTSAKEALDTLEKAQQGTPL